MQQTAHISGCPFFSIAAQNRAPVGVVSLISRSVPCGRLLSLVNLLLPEPTQDKVAQRHSSELQTCTFFVLTEDIQIL